ncbi:hypothetical protein ACFLRI_04315 [Bacteroidota bacterium]
MLRKFLWLALVVLLLDSCEKPIEEDALKVDGRYRWYEAVDTEGRDLLKKQEYQSASFFRDGTYEIMIDSTITFGDYSIEEGNTILRLDRADIWEIIQHNDTIFVIRNVTRNMDKWGLFKESDVMK